MSFVYNDLAGKTVSSQNGSTLGGTTNITGNLQFNGVSGSSGQFLKKQTTSQSFQTFALTDIPAGPNNRALFTRSGSVQYSQVAPSDITPGSEGQTLTIVTGNPVWATPLRPRFLRYGTTFAAQDLNATVGPNPCTFDTTPFVNLVSTGVTTISQPSATQFTIGTTGNYDIDMTGNIDPASSGFSDSVVLLSVEVSGTELGIACISSRLGAFSGKIPSVNLNGGATVRILTRRLPILSAGNQLLTFAAPATPPNFSSTIVFTLVNTVV